MADRPGRNRPRRHFLVEGLGAGPSLGQGALHRRRADLRFMGSRTTSRIGPVLLVCSSGGHLLQLTRMRDAWEPFDRVWVTFDKSDSRSLLAGERVVHAYGPTNRNIPNLLRNLLLASRVLATVRPSALLTTGAGLAVPFAWLARLRRVPVVYVESMTRIDELSLSGRMIAPIASRLYVQWPETVAAATGARFAGNLMDPWSSSPPEPTNNPSIA
jgi:beta-1,4-N-acetylglucosaminyltransferase